LDLTSEHQRSKSARSTSADGRWRSREQAIDVLDGRVEQDPATTWRLLVEATRETLSGAGAGVAAIAVSNQRGTVVALDAHGQPLGPYVVWMDRRGVSWTGWLAEAVGRDAYYAECGHPIVPYTGISKLIWHQRAAAETFEAAETIGPPQTLLLRRLGCDENVCDVSTGTFLFPFDIRRQTWSETIAAGIEFPLAKLPRPPVPGRRAFPAGRGPTARARATRLPPRGDVRAG
jgi:sugar (pentulose or hexulose) kinase